MKRFAKHSANDGKDKTFIEACFDANEERRNGRWRNMEREAGGARLGGRMAGQRKQEPGKIRRRHTCMLHFVTSRGVIPAWVKPQARAPPSMHLA